MRRLAVLLAAGLLLGLAGCSAAWIAQKPVDPATAENTVLAAKQTYEALLIVAVNYNKLPRCGAPSSPPLCSSQDAVVQLRKADQAARATLDAAESTVRGLAPDATVLSTSVAAATNAVAAFKAVTAVYNLDR